MQPMSICVSVRIAASCFMNKAYQVNPQKFLNAATIAQ
jgi:hypothetical protein